MSTHTYQIAEHVAPGTCLVKLAGDIDTAVVPELKEGLGAALGGGCENIVLDLEDVVYADSSALGLLVWLDHLLSPKGGRLMLVGANSDVQRILELSGLVSVAASIGTSTDVEGAIAGLQMVDKPTKLLHREDIVVPADVNELARVRERVCTIFEPLGFQESALFDIRVALGEALANAVRHGSKSAGDATIRVGALVFTDRVVVEVCDSGAGFDGVHYGSDDIYAPGGRGIMFMKALMDRVEFENPPEGGTCVRLVKHRSNAGA